MVFGWGQGTQIRHIRIIFGVSCSIKLSLMNLLPYSNLTSLCPLLTKFTPLPLELRCRACVSQRTGRHQELGSAMRSPFCTADLSSPQGRSTSAPETAKKELVITTRKKLCVSGATLPRALPSLPRSMLLGRSHPRLDPRHQEPSMPSGWSHLRLDPCRKESSPPLGRSRPRLDPRR
jgi:hypothetical protein